MSNTVLVSIGIPTYNRSHYVLDAVRSCLDQTYTHLEIIVADNASTDDTWEKLTSLEDPRLRFIRQSSNIGGAGNFNSCLNSAQGELFLLLCDDDVLEPTAIEKLSQPFREGSESAAGTSLGLTWSIYLNVDQHRNPLWVSRKGPDVETSVSFIEGLFDGVRGPMLSGILMRTDDIRRFGGYDGNRHAMLSDAGNWGRVALAYDRVVCLPEPLMRYTIHAETATNKEGTVKDWQERGEIMYADFVDVLRSRGDTKGEKRLAKAKKHLMANLTVSVLMRYKGQPGWVGIFLREIWRSRAFMLTPFVAKRLAKDGWKLLRL